MFKHLLVPTDGSELSAKAVRRAIEFAREASAQVTFFFARPDHPVALFGEGAVYDPNVIGQLDALAEAQARQVLGEAEQLGRQAGVECSSLSLISNFPYEAIIQAAESKGCDLICMASHGRRGLSGFFLGSQTQKVLTHSKIPVLVFR